MSQPPKPKLTLNPKHITLNSCNLLNSEAPGCFDEPLSGTRCGPKIHLSISGIKHPILNSDRSSRMFNPDDLNEML